MLSFNRLLSLVVLLTLPLAASAYHNETRFKQMIFHDKTNDEAMYMTTEELLNRSGFKYEEYYAVADDGYITQVLRVINPKADRSQLKHPPILMLHGSHLDTSIYVVSSSIQHHPEPWPRKPSDGIMTSSNRSLAFMLANNGFDVWLLGSRGSNTRNSAYTTEPKRYQMQQPHFKPDSSMLAFSWTPNYWFYGLDDIIEFELRNQIDLIRNITGFRDYSYFSFSISTLTTMAFMAENPEYARDVRLYTQMAPAVVANHFSGIAKFYWEKVVPYMPTRGIGFSPSYILDDVLAKNLVLLITKSPKLRYSLMHQVARFLFGPSPPYMTNLERNVIGHLLQPVSFKSAQHYGQISKARKFNKFDYGPLKNLIRYNQTKPPAHKIDKLDVQEYLIISGSLDALADPITVQRLKETTKTRKPIKHIIAPGFNHIDLIAAVENDVYVNLPFLELLNARLSKAPTKLISKPLQNAITPGKLTLTAEEERAQDAAQTKTILGT